jgi:hypothetical protein
MLTNVADISTLDCCSLSPTLWIFLGQVVKLDVSDSLKYSVLHTQSAYLLVPVIQMWVNQSNIFTLDYHSLVPTLWIYLGQVVKLVVSESLKYSVMHTESAYLLVQVIQMWVNQSYILALDYHSLFPTLWIFLEQVVKVVVSESLKYSVLHTQSASLLVQVIQMWVNQSTIFTLDYHSLVPTLWIYLGQVVK